MADSSIYDRVSNDVEAGLHHWKKYCDDEILKDCP